MATARRTGFALVSPSSCLLLSWLLLTGLLFGCGGSSPATPGPVPAAPTLVIPTTSLPPARVGSTYNQSIAATGGTKPYTFSAASGSTLPAGMAMTATGVLQGVPTQAGASQFTALVTDSGSPAQTATVSLSFEVAPALPPVVITTASLLGGTVGAAYTQTLAATGGAAPYTFSVFQSALPAGLTLSAAGVISGTPTAPGEAFTTVQVSDASIPALTATALLPITIVSPLSITTASLAQGSTGKPYSQVIQAAGGSAPYAFSLAPGSAALPAGLSLSGGGTLSGTPTTGGTTQISIQVSDSSIPARTATANLSVTVIAAIPTLGITTSSLPAASVGTPYTQTIAATGGTPPYAFSLAPGSAILPAPLTLNPVTGVISGTPAAASTTAINVLVTDAGTPHQIANATLTLSIVAAPPQSLQITTTALPGATAGVLYTSPALTAAGGTGPYNFSIASGSALPTGLALSIGNYTISGIPTAAGVVTFTVQVTDNSQPANTATAVLSITVAPPAALSATLTGASTATVGTPYTGSIHVTGGVSPYTFGATLAPPWIRIDSQGNITGTPTVAGQASFSVQVTDSSTPAQTAVVLITITVAPPAALTIAATTLPTGTVGSVYPRTSLASSVSGGITPYTFSIVSGAPPAGLSLSNGVISGTPTATATSTPLTIQVSDSSTPAQTATAQFTITVAAAGALTITTGALPDAVVSSVYAQTIAVRGGTGAHTFSVSMGNPPPGLTLDPATGIIAGIPTTTGSTSFTVQATDSASATATANLTLNVVAGDATGNSLLNGTYFFSLAGLMPLAASPANRYVQAGTFTADGAGNLTSGIFDYTDTNGNAYRAITFTGKYAIGADHRGFISLSTVVGGKPVSFTVALGSLQGAGANAFATTGQLVENDGNLPTGPNSSQGHFGSGTLQLVTSQSAGIAAGNWVFGLSGSTCPNCSGLGVQSDVSAAGILALGTANLTGSGDFAAGNFTDSNLVLSGSTTFTAGATRGTLSLNAPGSTQNEVPSNLAVYLIDGTHAWLITEDASDNSILSGPLELQQTPTYSAASLSGSFVSYENQQNSANAMSPDTVSNASLTLFAADGAGGLTGTTDQNRAGSLTTAHLLTSLTYAVAANGRVTITGSYGGVNSAAPVLWLVSANHGYGTEQPAAATDNPGLITFENQTGGPFSTASLSGRYTAGTGLAAVSSSYFTSGVLSAPTAGNLTGSLDLSSSGTTTSAISITGTYTMATNGVGTVTAAGLSTAASTGGALYMISPARILLLDESAGNAAPVIQILQQ